MSTDDVRQDGLITFSTRQVAESKRMALLNMNMGASEVVKINEHEFVIDPGVFSPKLFCSTEIFAKSFPFQPGGRLLEIGCGTGVMPVLAVKAGMAHVLAVDINDLALKNTIKNAQRHGINSEIEVRYSDIFDGVRPNEKFDIIYWNTPFITAPSDYTFDNVIERALFDPGYKLLKRFIEQCGDYLRPNGAVLVGISDGGGLAYFFDLCRQHGFSVTEVHKEYAVEGSDLFMSLFLLSHGQAATKLNCLQKNYDYYAHISFTSYKAADELRQGLRILNGIDGDLVGIFGSHRVSGGNDNFAAAGDLATALVAAGFGVVTGGGPGIMLAANRAAHAAGGVSIGFKATPLTNERIEEDIYSHRADFYWLFTRRFLMGVRSCALVFFPGGYGTLNELFEYAMLMQTDICDHIPMVCIGKSYWTGLFGWLHEQVGDKGYLISQREDLGLLHIVDTVEEAVAVIKAAEARRAAQA